MAIEIYYFSGTGNSFAVAKAIAADTRATVIPISGVTDFPAIATTADTIGVVFPAYFAALYGVPLIVERFIRKLADIETKYLFAVCTCGGYEVVNAVPTLRNLARLVRSLGGRLSAQFSVRLPMNNLNYDHIPVPIEKDSETIIERSTGRIAAISCRIASGKPDRYDYLKSLFNLLIAPMYHARRESLNPSGGCRRCGCSRRSPPTASSDSGSSSH